MSVLKHNLRARKVKVLSPAVGPKGKSPRTGTAWRKTSSMGGSGFKKEAKKAWTTTFITVFSCVVHVLSLFVNQTRFIILSPFVLCFYNKCFPNTFPEVVRVCISAPVISVFNIAVMFVQ